MLDEFTHEPRVAYFSMEIALRNEIPTYAGGLGVLAGDTVRSAADLQRLGDIHVVVGQKDNGHDSDAKVRALGPNRRVFPGCGRRLLHLPSQSPKHVPTPRALATQGWSGGTILT